MSSVNFQFSRKLFLSRIKKGYTQEQVSEAVSISTRWYQKLERGDFLPGNIIMLRLIIFLDIDFSDMVDELGIIEPAPAKRGVAPYRFIT